MQSLRVQSHQVPRMLLPRASVEIAELSCSYSSSRRTTRKERQRDARGDVRMLRIKRTTTRRGRTPRWEILSLDFFSFLLRFFFFIAHETRETRDYCFIFFVNIQKSRNSMSSSIMFYKRSTEFSDEFLSIP